MGRGQKRAAFPFTSEHRPCPGEDEAEAGNGKKAHLAQGGKKLSAGFLLKLSGETNQVPVGRAR